LKGKSGITHTVDILAEKRGKRERIILMKTRGKEASLEIIKAFLTATDAGAKAVYVTDRSIDATSKALLKEYKMPHLGPG